jgi:twitching motility protein PilJ
MEEVVAGNTDVTLTPLQNSDRLSNAFQKLLAKISDSIDAKKKLEKIQRSIDQLTKDLSPIRHGNLQVEILSESKELKEIESITRFLLNNLSEIISASRQESAVSRSSVEEIRQTLQSVIEQNEIRVQELNRAAVTLVEIPNSVQKISENLSKNAMCGNQSVETVRKGAKTSQQSRETIALIRKQLQETLSHIRSLHERSQEISQTVKTIEDLANRTNMIALNASIQAGKAGEKHGDFVVITEEIGRLASRAENTNKQISALYKSILSEIGKIENSLNLTSTEITKLSKFSVEVSSSLDELEKYLTRSLSSQEQLTSESLEQSVQTERAFQIFVSSISGNEKTTDELKNAEHLITRLTAAIENLHNATAFFKVAEPTFLDKRKDSSSQEFSVENFEPELKPSF